MCLSSQFNEGTFFYGVHWAISWFRMKTDLFHVNWDEVRWRLTLIQSTSINLTLPGVAKLIELSGGSN